MCILLSLVQYVLVLITLTTNCTSSNLRAVVMSSRNAVCVFLVAWVISTAAVLHIYSNTCILRACSIDTAAVSYIYTWENGVRVT